MVESITGRTAKSAGGWWLPISGGWLPADVGANWNWWQMGFDVVGGMSRSAMVEACISAYSQTAAMLPGFHWRLNANGGRERVTNSALSRVLRKPNSYQSISDFMLNATRSLYAEGNAYALALRNSRFEIEELHLMSVRSCNSRIAVNGAVFYDLGGNDIIERRIKEPLVVPQRDVLHIRLHTTRDLLKGESPIMAAALDVASGGAIAQQQLAFYLNQARPSQVLTTDQQLTQQQADELRARWDEVSKGLNQGGTPILSNGLKPHTMATSARDAELADIMKMSKQNIALAFRVPLQMLGIGDTPFAATEALMQFWLGSGLGFCLNHIEGAFERLFGLKGEPDEYMEFDRDALLRSAFKEQVEGLARGVQGGIFAPNEAREKFHLPDVEFGNEPRVQAQVVPLSAARGIPTAPAAPASPAVQSEKAEGANADDNRQLLSRFRASHARELSV